MVNSVYYFIKLCYNYLYNSIMKTKVVVNIKDIKKLNIILYSNTMIHRK